LAEIISWIAELFERGAVEVPGDLLVFGKQSGRPVAITLRQIS